MNTYASFVDALTCWQPLIILMRNIIFKYDDQDSERGLSFEVIALRDIDPDEEVRVLVLSD